MKKNLIKFAMMAMAMFTMVPAMTSCSKDDEVKKESTNDILTYEIVTTYGLTPGDKLSEFQNIVNGVVLSTFTAPKNATAEELNEKVIQITKAANMEAVVKDKAVAAGLKVYSISFRVVGEGGKRVQDVSYVIRYSETKDAEDIVQLHTMFGPNFQATFGLSKAAEKDLQTICDTYESKFSFTFTGKKDEAYNAMKKYLESDEAKDFREALQKHIATYKDADKWYVSFVMKSANGLLSDQVYFGDWR